MVSTKLPPAAADRAARPAADYVAARVNAVPPSGTAASSTLPPRWPM